MTDVRVHLEDETVPAVPFRVKNQVDPKAPRPPASTPPRTGMNFLETVRQKHEKRISEETASIPFYRPDSQDPQKP